MLDDFDKLSLKNKSCLFVKIEETTCVVCIISQPSMYPRFRKIRLEKKPKPTSKRPKKGGNNRRRCFCSHSALVLKSPRRKKEINFWQNLNAGAFVMYAVELRLEDEYF